MFIPQLGLNTSTTVAVEGLQLKPQKQTDNLAHDPLQDLRATASRGQSWLRKQVRPFHSSVSHHPNSYVG